MGGIIDFDQAWRDQDDLDALCRAPDDYQPTEKFDYNEAYGYATILKQYSGYLMDRSIEAVIPHGVYLDASLMIKSELLAPVPVVLNYPAFRARAWEGHDKIVVASASPFLYALRLFRERFKPRPDSCGTLFFPAHTIEGTRTTARWEKVAAELLGLDPEFQPVTVCIRTGDYTQGAHLAFARAGLRIVSAGNAADPQFIYRWLHLLSDHRYVVSNDVGSAVLFATAAGVPVRLLRDIAEHVLNDPTILVIQNIQEGRAGAIQGRETRKRIVELYRIDAGNVASDLRTTVDYLLGAENFKTPEGLRADLEYAASLAG